MANINEILARAAALRNETALNSIDPERAGGIMYDTLIALNELWLQQGAALVISKIYASVAAMNADTSPVSDLTGRPIRPGMVVVIASSDSDNGSVYRYNDPDSPSWSLVGKIGNLEPVDSLDSDSTQLPLAARQGKVLDEKISQLGQGLNDKVKYLNKRHIRTNSATIYNADGSVYFGTLYIQKYASDGSTAIPINSTVNPPASGAYTYVLQADNTVVAKSSPSVDDVILLSYNSEKVVYGGALYADYIKKTITQQSDDVYLESTVRFNEDGSVYFGRIFVRNDAGTYRGITINQTVPLVQGNLTTFFVLRGNSVFTTSSSADMQVGDILLLERVASDYFFGGGAILPVATMDKCRKVDNALRRTTLSTSPATAYNDDGTVYIDRLYIKYETGGSSTRLNIMTTFTPPASGAFAYVLQADNTIVAKVGADILASDVLLLNYTSEKVVYGGALYTDYIRKTTQPQITAVRKSIELAEQQHPYPFELGGYTGYTSGPLTPVESTKRYRIDVPVKNIGTIRIINEDWGIYGWSVYTGGLPASTCAGQSFSSSPVGLLNLQEKLSGMTLTFVPERLALTVCLRSGADIETPVPSIETIIAIDKIDLSLYGRDFVVLGDSTSAISNHNCWARVLSGYADAMGIFGHFVAVGGTGWMPGSGGVDKPSALEQWDSIVNDIKTRNPIITICTGGNDRQDQPSVGPYLSYEDTYNVCKQDYANPANQAEWTVHTLRKILSDFPMARIYLISNIYVTDNISWYEDRLKYREMLKAYCDFFSITLIDNSRNSQIRGYIENDANSSGYHIYTDDGIHADKKNGRYLIYHKTMQVILASEKYNV